MYNKKSQLFALCPKALALSSRSTHWIPFEKNTRSTVPYVLPHRATCTAILSYVLRLYHMYCHCLLPILPHPLDGSMPLLGMSIHRLGRGGVIVEGMDNPTNPWEGGVGCKMYAEPSLHPTLKTWSMKQNRCTPPTDQMKMEAAGLQRRMAKIPFHGLR